MPKYKVKPCSQAPALRPNCSVSTWKKRCVHITHLTLISTQWESYSGTVLEYLRESNDLSQQDLAFLDH